MNTDFERVIIGKSNPAKCRILIAKCELLFDSLTKLYEAVKEFLGTPVSQEELWCLIDGEVNAEEFLYERYFEIRNIDVPGISKEKLIEKKLLDHNPSNALKILGLIKEQENELDRLKVEPNLWWDEFFNQETEAYEVDERLIELIDTLSEVYTENSDQNEILYAIQLICKGLNLLQNKAGASQKKPSWGKMNLIIDQAIQWEKSENAFKPNPLMFKKGYFARYKEPQFEVETN